ncbi:hypothetical protein B0H13DRAFT_2354908 [Mycena leptocephala]|nr:hypothetical protein B0H13DRAFT_2354908 [Mycena leptocephala]
MSTHVEPKDIQAACAPTFSSPFPHSVSMRRMSTLTTQTPHNALLPPCTQFRESFQMRAVGSLGVHDLHPSRSPSLAATREEASEEEVGTFWSSGSLISDALTYSYTYLDQSTESFHGSAPSVLAPPSRPSPSLDAIPHVYSHTSKLWLYFVITYASIYFFVLSATRCNEP